MSKIPNEYQLQNERHEIKHKSGGGTLRYEVWGYVRDGVTVVTRYNIAYVNRDVCHRDNGRVLGYDNAHDYHHRHYMGKIEPADFVSFRKLLRHLKRSGCRSLQRLKQREENHEKSCYSYRR